MRRVGLALALVLCVAACDGLYQIVVVTPYCPVSDSAKAKADSIPLPCLFPDTTRDSTP